MRLFKTFYNNLRHTLRNVSSPEDVIGDSITHNYGALRADLKTGDIMVASVGTGVGFADVWFGRLISAITGYRIYHVGMIIKMDGRYFVLEAMVPRVRLSLLSTRLPCDIIKVNDKSAMLGNERAFTTKALGYLGIPYSLVDVVMSYFKKDIPSDNGVHCVELTRFLLKMGYDIDSNTLIPGEFVKELLNKGYKTVKVK